MQRVHLKQSSDHFGGAEYLLADHLRELYLDFEGIEIVLADPLGDDEDPRYNRMPHRKQTDQTFFIPFENVRAFDSTDDEFDNGTIGTNKTVEFREDLKMFGGATKINADEIIDRPPGVKVVKDQVNVIVPQGNLVMVGVDEDGLS